MGSRRPDPGAPKPPTTRGTASAKPGADPAKGPPQPKRPEMTAERRYQLLCVQLDNAEKMERALEQEAIEI